MVYIEHYWASTVEECIDRLQRLYGYDTYTEEFNDFNSPRLGDITVILLRREGTRRPLATIKTRGTCKTVRMII